MESGDEPEASNLRRGNKDRYRHSPYQRQQLKAYFKKWDFPDENQRQQLSRELGLSPTQIKCWFQNERSQLKEKNGNEALREQHRAIKCQNDALRMAFLTMNCSNCGGPASGDEEWQESFQKLQLENAQLKDQYDKLISLASHYFGRPISEVESLASAASSLLELSHGSSMGNTDGTEEVGSLETSTLVNSPSE